MTFVLPPALERGAEVAVVAPAGGHATAYPGVYELGLERLREFDLDPVEFPTASRDGDYLYAHPEERARDIERAFRDPDIEGVVATIGGNDQIRILDHLDASVLGEHPTRFFGISDNTVLHAVLWEQGIISFYGGQLMTDLAVPNLPDYTRDHLTGAFFGEPGGPLEPAAEFTDEAFDWGRDDYADGAREWEPNPGRAWYGAEERATGRAWGGCLEVVYSLLAADRLVPDADDLVLCLETSEELPAEPQVRRMLLGLGERGLLDRVAAVLVGRPAARSHVVSRLPEERRAYRDRQYDAVAEVVGEYNPDAPVVCGLDFGHTAPTSVPPLGYRVTVDPRDEAIVFE